MSQDTVQSLVGGLLQKGLSRRAFVSRAAALGLSGTAISAILQACGDSSSQQSGQSTPTNLSGQITVWTWPDNDKTFAKTIPFFNKKFPNIKVNVQAFANADTDYANKLLTAILSGSGPDVAMIEIGVVAKFKTKPGFVDLSKDPYNAGQYKDKFASYSWKYVSDDQTGKIFALPKNTGPGAMFYRRDLFQKAGLPTEPAQVSALLKDWDAFISVGKQLTVKNSQWMVAVPSQILLTIVNEAGLSYFDKQGKIQFGNPDYKTAMEYSKRAWDAGIISPLNEWSAEWGATMQNGTVATYLYGNWFGGLLKSAYAQNTSGKWGVAQAPAYKGVSAFDSGGDFIGILEGSQNKQLAWEFVKFVTQDPDSLKTMYLANDLYPAWSPVLTESWINNSDAYYSGQTVNQVFAKVQQGMVPPVTNPNDSAGYTALSGALNDVIKGQSSIDDALAKATQQLKTQSGQ